MPRGVRMKQGFGNLGRSCPWAVFCKYDRRKVSDCKYQVVCGGPHRKLTCSRSRAGCASRAMYQLNITKVKIPQCEYGETVRSTHDTTSSIIFFLSLVCFFLPVESNRRAKEQQLCTTNNVQ